MRTYADYIYKADPANPIHCYGECHEGQNFYIVCDDENYDGAFFDRSFKTWPQACKWLTAHYRKDIIQLEAV